MKYLLLLFLLALGSCARDPGSSPAAAASGALYSPDKPIMTADAWAYDPSDPQYGSAAARKIRFRDSWMSFHNYFDPADVRGHTGGFDAWFAKTPTDHVKNGGEYQFTLNLFR